MINAVYDRSHHCFSMEGHAYSGEAGHDLVCSAASILAYTLAASVTNAAKLQGKAAEIQMDSGYVMIHLSPDSLYSGAITLIYDTVCVGFELLARNYPENISYTIVE